jgi:CheY-like chemotaxis protein
MSQIPAIAISGYASQDDRQRALKVGYAALIAKPIDVDALFALIQDLRLGAVPQASSELA